MSESKQLVCFEASAGSGKTYSLAMRYVYLLFEGAKVEEILTLTFTKKAVKEMGERIARFLEILAGEECEEKSNLIKNLNQHYALHQTIVQENAKRLLKNFYISTPKIMTIDAFFNSIAKRFCWYMGIPYNFSPQKLETKEIYEHFLSTLQDKQKEFLLEFCLSHDQSLSQILNMIDQVNANYPNSLKQLLQGDLEKIRAKILQEAKSIADRILNHPQASDTAKKNVSFKNFDDLLSKNWILKREQYHYFKNLKLSPSDFNELTQALKEYFCLKESISLGFIEQFRFHYSQSKSHMIKKHNALDFSDITQKCYSLLCENKISSDFFYFRLDEKISHILLDEFQDTSVLQYKILYPLIVEICSGNGRIKERSFFVVGDQKQSIYSFRGGKGRLMRDVRENFSLKDYALNTNYRSGEVIVEFVNQVFEQCMSDYTKQNSQKSGGYVKIFPQILFEKDTDNKSIVFDQIHSTLEELLQKGARLDEIAILCFNNQEVLEIGDFLKKYYQHITTEESISLDKKRDAQILLNALQYSLNPQETNSLAPYNLAKLLGQDIDSPPPYIAWKDQSIEEFIYQSIKLYALNSLEAQKMLELACESKNIEEFICNVKNFNGLEEEKQGLRILTIHKSKGLEFPHLIVVDKMSRGGNDKDPLFCHYDQELKATLFLKQKNREEFDEIYAYAKQVKKEKERKEKQNLLYVALTRAVESLWIMPIHPYRGNSAFENIGLVDKDGALLLKSEYGKLENITSIKNEKNQPLLEVVTQKDFGRQESFIKVKEKIYKPNHIPAIKRGDAFHKALELYLGYKCPILKIGKYLKNHYGIYLNMEEEGKILESLQKISSLFVEKFHFSELKTEVSFMVEDKLYRIDCLLLCKDENQTIKKAIVIDYKSGGENKTYEDQIRRYANFVKIVYPQAEVRGYLMYQHNLDLHQVICEGV
ncbi:RecB-like helicase [Helicobacter cholecystus]|uniref:RecB-like helicase n=1 Tax=Helicobacter cholecystus TaxID=45498 RepID=UPI002738B9A9|nr:RecB-like helicase [Helicobacter cholecystus]